MRRQTATVTFALVLAAAAPAAAECRFTLHFPFASARIALTDALLLDRLARAYPAGPVALSAHADDDGSQAGNLRVSRARADAVIARMRRAGLSPAAVSQALSLGDAWPAVPATGSSSALNRRVELFVAGCDPAAHPESRPVAAPGVVLRAGKAQAVSPRLPAL